jgi:hypothetical protein
LVKESPPGWPSARAVGHSPAMRRVSATTWVCTGCNRPLRFSEDTRPVEVELTAHGEPPVRIIAVGSRQVHRCSPTGLVAP